jgi:putative ABC transport system permease protein
MTAAWGALLRLARRDARQHPGRAALVVLLIAVPVAGLVAAATLTMTIRPTADELARAALGSADLAAYPTDGTAVPPAGGRTEPLWRGELTVAGSTVAAIGVDLTGLGAGMFEVDSGQPPAAGAEGVALTAPLARRLGAGVGDAVQTSVGAVPVVAILRDPMAVDREAAVVAPDQAPAPSGYLVDLPPDTDPDSFARTLERAGWDAATRAEVSRSDSDEVLLILVLGGFGFLVTCLVTAAAFAVSAQRRRHDLALLAAAGAESRHLRRSVSSSALLLGAAGSAMGVLLGIAASAASLPWLDSLTNRAIDGLAFSPVVLVAAAAVGIVVAMAAAWFTARTAGRTPVAAALTGRQPPRTSSTRLLVAGAAATGLGALLTLATAGFTGSTAGGEVLFAGGLLLAATLTMLGLGAMSPWLVEQLARWLGTSVPVGVRLAMRDTARFRSRTGPIVMAIVAGLGLSVAVGATVETVEAGLARDYRPELAADQLIVDGSAPVPLVRELRETLPVEADAAMTIIAPVESSPTGRQLPQVVTVAGPELLAAVGAPPSAAAALSAGEVVVLHDPGSEPATGLAELIAPGAVRVVELDLAPDAVPPIVLSAETLERSGAVPAQEITRWLVRLAGPVDDAQRQQARELAARFGQRVTVETGPLAINSGAIQAVVLAGAGALSLLIVGVGLALISREARRDDSVLTCVGASPQDRRGLAAARAGTLTLLGGVLAIPAGLLPIWGLSTASVSGATDEFAFPGPSIVAVVVLVPAVAAAAAWILTRPAPADLTPQDA